MWHDLNRGKKYTDINEVLKLNEKNQFDKDRQKLGTLKKATENKLKSFGTDHGVKLTTLTSIEYYKNYWNKMGIHEGIIVTSIDGSPIYSIDDVERTMASRSPHDPLNIELINKNGDRERYSFNR